MGRHEAMSHMSTEEIITQHVRGLLEGELEIEEVNERLSYLEGRAVFAVEGPVYSLGWHRQLGITWLKPPLKEQRLSIPVLRPSWMRDGTEILYRTTGLDADGEAVLVGDFYVEDGRPLGIKLAEIESIKVSSIRDVNIFDEESDQHDENIFRLAQ